MDLESFKTKESKSCQQLGVILLEWMHAILYRFVVGSTKVCAKPNWRRLDWERNLTKSGICFVEWQERNFSGNDFNWVTYRHSS